MKSSADKDCESLLSIHCSRMLYNDARSKQDEARCLMSNSGAEKIYLKNARGIIQCVTPAAFQKMFGVVYMSNLLVDGGCPDPEHTEPALLPRKLPSESRRAYFEEQFVKINDDRPQDGGSMKQWLYADQIRRGHAAKVYIAKVNDFVGYGLFAMEDLRAGELLGEYTGLARLWRNSDFTNPYVFNYVEGAIVDASKRGNFTRFINHANQLANARYMRVIVDGVVHIIILAYQKIAKDEQILFNYGEQYWENRMAPSDLHSTDDRLSLVFPSQSRV